MLISSRGFINFTCIGVGVRAPNFCGGGGLDVYSSSERGGGGQLKFAGT